MVIINYSKKLETLNKLKMKEKEVGIMLNNRRLNGMAICNRQLTGNLFTNGTSASIFNNNQFNRIYNITLPQDIDF